MFVVNYVIEKSGGMVDLKFTHAVAGRPCTEHKASYISYADAINSVKSNLHSYILFSVEKFFTTHYQLFHLSIAHYRTKPREEALQALEALLSYHNQYNDLGELLRDMLRQRDLFEKLIPGKTHQLHNDSTNHLNQLYSVIIYQNKTLKP